MSHTQETPPLGQSIDQPSSCPIHQKTSSLVDPSVPPTPSLMSFGDGPHRCPGSYLAIQETDIFLQRLLTLDTLHIKRRPTLAYNDVSQGYELRDFLLTTAPPDA